MLKGQFNHLYLTGLAMVAAMGGLLFGYDWVVIGGAKPFYEAYFDIAGDPYLSGWAVSCALLGCILGTLISGSFSQRYGRKSLLMISALLFLASAVGTGIAESFTPFILYRILGGIGIGIASNLSPIYIAELAPSQLRGRFVSINQLTIVIGILLAQIINWLIAEPVPEGASPEVLLQSWNGQTGWRYMFWAEAIPAFLFFVLIWGIPNSPRWLVQRGKTEAARKTLETIGGAAYAQTSLEEIKQSFQAAAQQVKGRLLLSKAYFPVILIGIVLAVLQQWCGINVIFLYAEEVFSAAGYSVSGMLLSVVITGTVNLIFTVLAMAQVDKLGRKKLMLIGFAGLTFIYLLLGFLYYQGTTGVMMLVLILSAIACYAFTLAPVTWVLLSEIFPNKIRESAMAVATFALWAANMLLAYFFPIINQQVGAHGSFWLFAVICGAGLWFVQRRISETSGKSLEEIEQQLQQS